jgi:hypothetical protein
LQENTLKSCFFDFAIKKNVEKLLRDHLIIDPVGFNIEDIRKFEKKGKFKKAKARK